MSDRFRERETTPNNSGISVLHRINRSFGIRRARARGRGRETIIDGVGWHRFADGPEQTLFGQNWLVDREKAAPINLPFGFPR